MLRRSLLCCCAMYAAIEGASTRVRNRTAKSDSFFLPPSSLLAAMLVLVSRRSFWCLYLAARRVYVFWAERWLLSLSWYSFSRSAALAMWGIVIAVVFFGGWAMAALMEGRTDVIFVIVCLCVRFFSLFFLILGFRAFFELLYLWMPVIRCLWVIVMES